MTAADQTCRPNEPSVDRDTCRCGHLHALHNEEGCNWAAPRDAYYCSCWTYIKRASG
jgi:hypothetical protein